MPSTHNRTVERKEEVGKNGEVYIHVYNPVYLIASLLKAMNTPLTLNFWSYL